MKREFGHAVKKINIYCNGCVEETSAVKNPRDEVATEAMTVYDREDLHDPLT